MDKPTRHGILAAIAAYLIWGILPVYWKTLGMVSPLEILSWRVAGCGVTAWLFVLFRRRPAPRGLLTGFNAALVVSGSLLIVCNWGIYIWAVSKGRILEASLGYYINPLVSVLLGVVFFSEKLGRVRYIALALALAGVVLMTLDAGTFPCVSVLLALLFGFYGLVVKRMPRQMDNVDILAWETVLLSPLALGYLVYLGINGNLHLSGFGAMVTTMLVLAGGVTFLPLWLFGVGTRRIRLSSMGFLQFISPTMMLLLGVLVYREPFGVFRAVAFVVVAAALVLYSLTLRDS
jgi:chloramphenicol-sensitive protein RarD